MVWRGILKLAPAERRLVAWKVGDGRSTLFWFDCWLSTHPLISTTLQPIPVAWQVHTVSHYWCPRKGWLLEELQPYLPVAILLTLSNISENLPNYKRMCCYGGYQVTANSLHPPCDSSLIV